MPQKTNEIALPSSALLCNYLIDTQGEESHHVDGARHARFESEDLDGREYSVLIVQLQLGQEAVYRMYVHDVFDGTHESVYSMSLGGDSVVQHIKTKEKKTELPYHWPADTARELLRGCIDRKVY